MGWTCYNVVLIIICKPWSRCFVQSLVTLISMLMNRDPQYWSVVTIIFWHVKERHTLICGTLLSCGWEQQTTGIWLLAGAGTDMTLLWPELGFCRSGNLAGPGFCRISKLFPKITQLIHKIWKNPKLDGAGV